MTINVHTILLLIGAILILVSSVATTPPIDLFKLGWGFVALSFVFGGAA